MANWKDVLEQRWNETDRDHVLLFHPEEPRGHILQEGRRSACEVGASPEQFIKVPRKQVGTKLASLGLSVDGWE